MSEKLETDLTSARKRAAALVTKRAAAKAEFDSAVSERETYLLTGDIDNEVLAMKHQARVDGAASKVSGLDSALMVISIQVGDLEQQLRAERERIERARVADEMTVIIEAARARLTPWLEDSRSFVAALSKLGGVSFEIDQCAQYLAKIIGEVELALNFALPDLVLHAEAIKQGHEVTPKFPRPVEVVELVNLPGPTSPGEAVREVFCVKPVKWRGLDGQQHFAQAWTDIELPERLLGRASQRGAVTLDMSDQRRRTHRGILNAYPVSNYIDLDVEILPPDPEQLPPGFVKMPTRPDRKVFTPGPNI